MLLMHDAAVITMERHGKYYDITVNEAVSFITTPHQTNKQSGNFMIIAIYWLFAFYAVWTLTRKHGSFLYEE
jgi:hypothetical protein